VKSRKEGKRKGLTDQCQEIDERTDDAVSKCYGGKER